jgi:hypothetical protein
MTTIAKIYDSEYAYKNSTVNLEGILLGGRNLFIVDTIEEFDRGIALPIRDDVHEALFASGVYGKGGGRFAFDYQVAISGKLAYGSYEYRFFLTNIVAMEVFYFGRKIKVI